MTSDIVAHRRRVNATAVASTGERRHELDWLRVLVIVGLIPFHVLGLFAIAMTNYLTSGQPNQLAVLVSNFFILWPMSLLFLVAGASTWFALGRRTPRQYTRERILRLFIPFLFATLVLIPIQVFAVVRAYPQVIDLNLIPSAGLRGDESFLEFYPPYLAGYAHFLTHFSSMGETVFWGHIWFVPRLLLYALATLPLLLWLRSTPGMRLIARIADMFVVPGTTLLLGVAIALPRILAALGYRTAIQISGKANWDIYNQWAQLGVFMMCFLLGYIFYASPRLLDAIRRDGTVALMLGVVSFALLQTPLGHFASVTEATPSGVLISWLRAESEWLLVAGVLIVGLRYFTFANRLLAYLNDAAYPLYVLHMPVVIVVGLVVIQMHLPTVATLLLVVLGALGGTLGLYEYVIKHVKVLRLMFGLKPAGATSETSG